jgi:hypothetical protein
VSLGLFSLDAVNSLSSFDKSLSNMSFIIKKAFPLPWKWKAWLRLWMYGFLLFNKLETNLNPNLSRDDAFAKGFWFGGQWGSRTPEGCLYNNNLIP